MLIIKLKILFQESFAKEAAKQYSFSYTNLLLVPPQTKLLSKIFTKISHVYSFKKYNYPRVTQTVSILICLPLNSLIFARN